MIKDNQNYDDMPDIVIEFLDYMLTIKNKSKKTISEYHYDLRTFLRYINVTKHNASEKEFSTLPVKNITLDDIKSIDLADLYSFMAYISRERKNSAVTRARKVACLKSFYKYLFIKVKLIEYNPAAELDSPKIVKRLPKYLNLEESVNLLQSVHGKKNVERDYAILVLFMNCGLRLSELVSINVNSVRGDILTVVGKGDKERTVYLNQACQDAITTYKAERDKLKVVKDPKALFLSERKVRISPKTVQYLVKKYIQASGLDPDKYSPHKLRHTAATLMYKHGHVDIRALQAILGHESIATTEIYTHVDEDQLRKAVKNNPLSSISPNKTSKKQEEK